MIRPGSSLSKAKKKIDTNYGLNLKKVEKTIPKKEDFIKDRDWVGVIALLEADRSVTDTKIDTHLWLAYCYFHNGDYKEAMYIYDDLMKKPQYEKDLHIYKSCCLYALQIYDEAKKECVKGFESPLHIRLMFHIAHKKDDEDLLNQYHMKIQEEDIPDQLCLAAIHYLRSHFEEALEIYKKLLLENKDELALNVYVSLCYYKLDFFDIAEEILNHYLAERPDSIIAVNLKACIKFQLYQGQAAEQELRSLQTVYTGGDIFQDFDLFRHNLVVFRGGENALQVLPPLVDIFPEARLNLVIYYLKNDNIEEAYKLVKDLETLVPRDYIIKGVVHAIRGQDPEYKNRADLKLAHQLFQVVGASGQECDTIPGRQCMASCFFLLRQFDEVFVYLDSIKDFMANDDDFHWNFGISLAAEHKYVEAEKDLLSIQNEIYKMDHIYISWLTRCYIMNGKPNLAWEMYIDLETSNESMTLLNLIANDCYKMGHFFYAAKAFHILEKLDNDIEYTEAKNGAVIGVFQMLIAGKETQEHFLEVVQFLKDEGSPQVEYILSVMRKWGATNNLQF